MDLGDQLLRYFGTTDLASVTPAALEGGREKLEVDFGLEQDPGRRFAMWAVLHVLGAAPDLDAAFASREEREMARAFIDMLARSWDS